MESLKIEDTQLFLKIIPRGTAIYQKYQNYFLKQSMSTAILPAKFKLRLFDIINMGINLNNKTSTFLAIKGGSSIVSQ
jgi:hypothetical protein